VRRARSGGIEAPGQDSFLDVVANLVGILIILVMVVGAQAKNALVAATAAADENTADLDAPRQAVARVESDIHQLDAQAKFIAAEYSARFQERGQLQLLVAAVERELEQRRQQLDEHARREFDLARDLAAAQARLQDLARRRDAIESSTATTEVIRHLPTPLAKTVFGREEHFRLLNGRIAHVPIDELVARLKADAPRKAYKLKEAAAVTETIGPVGNFWMRYVLRQDAVEVETRFGPSMQKQVEFDHFELVPVGDDFGEPLEDALRPGSQFRAILGGLSPDRTTITVWTYPDSYADFRRLKEELYRQGFLTAARPLPEGALIGGSPDGSRSAAQ
jgi:hypothetical protein